MATFAMRDKLSREPSAQNFETIENELERLWAALKETFALASAGGSSDAFGDVFGPASSSTDGIVLFSGVTGKIIKMASGTGVVHATSGVYSVSPVDLASEVTGLLPTSNLDLGGNASHALFGDGTVRAIVKADISDFAHRLLSADHSDTEPGTPEPGSLIVGVATGETIDAELYWLDGEPSPTPSQLADLGADDYWYDGDPLGAIGFSAAGKWAKLDPPTAPNKLPLWNGSAFEWVDQSAGAGDVVGPASADDDHVALYDGTTGKLIKNSAYSIPTIIASAARESHRVLDRMIEDPIMPFIPYPAQDIGKWAVYTPTWASSGVAPVLNNGTLFGRFQQRGQTVIGLIKLTIGNMTTLGTGFYTFTLPVASSDPGNTPNGLVVVFDASTGNFYQGFTTLSTTTVIVPRCYQGAGGGVVALITGAAPIALAVSDSIAFTFQYQGLFV